MRVSVSGSRPVFGDRVVRRDHQVVDAAQLDAGAHAAGTGLEGHVHRRAAALVHCCLRAARYRRLPRRPRGRSRRRCRLAVHRERRVRPYVQIMDP